MLRKLVAPMLVAALFLAANAGDATAEIVLAGDKADAKSWSFSTDGFLNTFYVYEDADEVSGGTPGVAAGGLGLITAGKSSTIRTGLLPGLLAFNIKAPETKGITITSRVGFYPQIQNGGTKSDFDVQIDTRELWFAADGAFGQVLAGKTLNLFQAKSILTDMSLFGVGSTGGPKANGLPQAPGGSGTTLGHIGSGYLYAEYGPNIRYTTPDLGGLKLAVSLTDPSAIGNVRIPFQPGQTALPAGGNVLSGTFPIGPLATKTETPGVEAEISYATKFKGGTAQAWVNGLYQRAKFAAGDNTGAAAVGSKVTARGVSGGAQVGFAGAELTATGFTGRALGSVLLLDIDSLDAAGEERKSSGFLVQGTYMIAPTSTKLGINYGMNIMDETAQDAADRAAGTSALENRSGLTLGVYQNITPSWQVMAEYTRTTAEWFSGAEQKSNVFAVGTFFFF